jgi:catechol-2,3-dioxygenase
MGAGAAFLRSAGSANDHDLGLFQIGTERPGPGPGRRGLYHLAWQVDTIEDLLSIAKELSARGSIVGSSDHGFSKSIYAVDPDGVEFEVMWAVPQDAWDSVTIGVFPLSFDEEVPRWAGVRTGHEANVAS